MLWFALYALILIGISVLQILKNKQISVDGFVVYERRGTWFEIGMSIVALVFGASAVFGLAGYAYKIGWNSIWWTLSGVICLIILSFTFVNTVWKSKGYTIADIVEKAFGKQIRFFVSLITFIAWLMVLAGQIIAGANVTGMLIHNESLAYILFAGLFTSYTFLAGQAGVIKSGFFQTLLMIAGLAVLFAAEYLSPSKGIIHAEPIGFSGIFSPAQFLSVFVPVGLAYLFGPDIYSRIFSSRDPDQAKKGILAAAVIITLVSILIVAIGIYSRNILGNVENPDKVIPLIFSHFLSGPLFDLVLIALISIPLSGADIILLTTATLFTKDVLHPILPKKLRKTDEPPINLYRLIILLAAVASAYLAIKLKAIIPTLLISYKIFTVGVVPLIFISLLAYRAGLEIKTKWIQITMGIYLALVSLLVLAVEMKWIKLSITNYNLWLILLNTVILSVLFLILLLRRGKIRQ